MEEMFTAKEVASLFNLSVASIANFRRRGDLRAQRVGHQWRYRISAIAEFFDLSEDEIRAGIKGGAKTRVKERN